MLPIMNCTPSPRSSCSHREQAGLFGLPKSSLPEPDRQTDFSKRAVSSFLVLPSSCLSKSLGLFWSGEPHSPPP